MLNRSPPLGQRVPSSLSEATLTEPARLPALDLSLSGETVQSVVPAPHRLWAVEQVERLQQLEEGWDSYHARVASATAAAQAKRIIQLLPATAAVQVSVVPTSSGGIQLEWHARGVDIEIEIASNGHPSIALEDQEAECDVDGTLSAHWLDAIKAMRRLA